MTEADKAEIESILFNGIPGYDPRDQKEDAWLDHDAAAHAINWFPDHLSHIEGDAKGTPFILSPWQAAIVGNIFGWKRQDDKGRIVRRYRRAFLYVPRGNGKTPLCAGIILYAFYEDKENGAQCYLAAGQSEQAGFLFRNASGMVEQHKKLNGRTTIYAGDQHRSLVLKSDRRSFVKVIPAEAAGQHGGIPHVICLDELHTQENRKLLDVFDTGMAKKVRSQPLLMMITTADYDRPSICNDTFYRACLIRDNGGKKDRPGYSPSFLPVIYKAADDADWKDEKVWSDPKCNPNIDVSVSRESLRELCQKAIDDPGFENEFRRLHLNQKTAQDVRLISLDKWDACGKTPITLEECEGKPCWGGGDLASKEDLSSFALVFDLGDGELAGFVWSWCPEAKLKLRVRRQFPYDVWHRDGWLESTPGNSTEYAAIREKILELDARFNISHTLFDPSNARETVNLLEDAGMRGRIGEIAQTHNNLSAPLKSLLSAIKDGKFHHDNNPVARWAAGNLAGYFKGKLPQGVPLDEALDKVPVMPSKQSSADKIDPIAALVNALAAKEGNPAVSEFEFRII